MNKNIAASLKSRLLIAGVVTLLLLHSGTVLYAEEKKTPDQMQNGLSKAISRGDFEIVKEFIEDGANLNGKDRHRLTPYQVAKISGYGRITDFLIEQGADGSVAIPPGDVLADTLLRRIIRKHSPGAAVLVSRDGKVLFEKGYGLADRENRRDVGLETKFRIGSVTKQFTAAAILRLQEEGKLSVKDNLSKFLPDFPRGDEVTLHHLLTHTSGIHSYTDNPGFMKGVERYLEPDELIEIIKAHPFDFDPGEQSRYSNSGYFILGHIVSKVSGKSLDAFLQSSFFKPLGMKSSGIYRNDAPPEGEALGYSFKDDTLTPAINWDMSQTGGAGALYSTIKDLNRWNDAIFSGKVLNEATLESAFSKTKTADGEEAPYGYGWGMGEHRGLKTIGHGGRLSGFLTNLRRYPDKNLTIVVFGNASPAAPGIVPGQLTQRIGEYFLWQDMDPRNTYEIDSTLTDTHLKDYVGTYDLGRQYLLVTKRGKQLFVQLGGQDAFEIFHHSKDEFFLRVVDAQMKFVRNDKGQVTHVIHYQNGNESKYPKIANLKTVEVDPEILETYVGKYNYGRATMTVTLRGKQLFAQLTGRARYEIFPKSENEFYWIVVQAEVAFLKGEDGKIEKARHKQGGREFDAPRIK